MHYAGGIASISGYSLGLLVLSCRPFGCTQGGHDELHREVVRAGGHLDRIAQVVGSERRLHLQHERGPELIERLDAIHPLGDSGIVGVDVQVEQPLHDLEGREVELLLARAGLCDANVASAGTLLGICHDAFAPFAACHRGTIHDVPPGVERIDSYTIIAKYN